jgi:hypothetical protein
MLYVDAPSAMTILRKAIPPELKHLLLSSVLVKCCVRISDTNGQQHG